MSENRVKVTTTSGQLIGYFVNPKVDNLCEGEWEISGRFVDEDGRPYEKVEFNPQAIPFLIDLTEISQYRQAGVLHNGYVQRGRQPVQMTGVELSHMNAHITRGPGLS